ncbi:MAG: apolipoprotein N-acyltransferase [Candidatus Omnitrophica bacterium]|nr:apolipoprotein N-acyltransferase [Candidatus Omnitrophota bacterium]
MIYPIASHPLVLALSSAGLLIFAFPPFNQPWCAWIGLVPWLILLRSCTAYAAFGFSYLIGFLFFLGSIWWLTYVTVIGCIVLCAFLALYFGVFGWLVCVMCIRPQTHDTRHTTHEERKHDTRFTIHEKLRESCVASRESNLWSLMSAPASWVVLEYARSHWFSGLGWNLLGYSQIPWLPMIQIASVTGVWGISFAVVFVNACLAKSLQVQKRMPVLLSAMMILLVLWGYGVLCLKRSALAEKIRISVVQGNIPQEEKWEEEKRQEILDQYARLTLQAAKEKPDLIVWPETSAPGYLGVEEELTQRVMEIARQSATFMLVGAPTATAEKGVWKLKNSAVLLGPDGNIRQQYDKLHLVPFGEFIPGERYFSWLRRFLPPIGDFVPGKAYTVFRMEGQGAGGRGRGHLKFPSPLAPRPSPPFSVLICFEDIFPELARRFVQEGARLLVVITNDAWFGPTAAAYQHAQASTLRAVELRVPLVRAANTGWSGCIDSSGNWQDAVQDAQGQELFVEGFKTCEVALKTQAVSFYQRFGDWLVLGCGSVLMVWWGLLVYNKSLYKIHDH